MVELSSAYKERYENADELGKMQMTRLLISIIGDGLMQWVNQHDLKDPPPPKEKKVKVEGDEGDDDEDEDLEEEDEDQEDQAAELEGDDDLDSEALRN